MRCHLGLAVAGEKPLAVAAGAHRALLRAEIREVPRRFADDEGTKLYGMAGVRLGYCLCSNTALLDKMQAAGQPWAVSSLAQAAGLAALDETAYVARVQVLIAQQRPILRDGLRALGLRVLDGSANYLLFQAPEMLGDALRQRGIVLRSCANYPGLGPGWYRTAVRTAPENQQLIKALQEVLA